MRASMVEAADAAAPTAAPAPPDARAADPGFGVYVHWPFCAAICPYCDFNRRLADGVDEARWRRALLAELDHAARETPGRRAASLFFGGGTPSLMAPETVARIIDAVAALWPAKTPGAPAIEVTLEANPSSVEAGRFRAYRDAGVNRLSLGAQSFRDESLAFLGRRHSAADAGRALEAAQDVFPRVSFDLIYGLPGQTAADWRRELTDAARRAGEHLSAYQLTIEPGTPFYRERVQSAGEEEGARLYGVTQDVLGRAGLPAYEVSNHATADGRCRHNVDVWRGAEYAAVGPGAHGRLRGPEGWAALWRIHEPARWLSAVEARRHGTAKRRPLSPRDRAREVLMTGLRLSDGVSRGQFRRLTSVRLDDVVAAGAVAPLADGGFIADDGDTLRATAAGRVRLDAVLKRLLVS